MRAELEKMCSGKTVEVGEGVVRSRVSSCQWSKEALLIPFHHSCRELSAAWGSQASAKTLIADPPSLHLSLKRQWRGGAWRGPPRTNKR